MKKILALVLAGAMAIGMSVTGFALIGDPVADATAATILANATGTGVTSGFINGEDVFYEAAVGSIRFWNPTLTTPANVPVIAAGQTISIPLTQAMFTSTNGAAGAWDAANSFTAASLAAVRAQINAAGATAGFSATISGTNLVITFPASVTRVTTFAFTVALINNPAFTTVPTPITLSGTLIPNPSGTTPTDPSVTTNPTTPTNIITSNVKATTFADGMSLAYGLDYDLYRTGRYGMYSYSYDVRPQDKVETKIWLLSDMFGWNATVANGQALTSQVVRNSKISARTQVSAGSKAFDSTDIKYNSSGHAYVRVKFVEEYVSTSKLEFEATVYLLIDGKRMDTMGEGLTLIGTLRNFEILCYSNDDYVDTSRGEVAVAQDFISKMEVDLGSGVTIHTKFFKDKKYYGTATRNADDAADIVFSRYADVDNVVILKTVGLNSTGDYISLSTDYADYYVYDKDLNYLGRATDKLAYSSRYYLANSKLNISDESDEPSDEPSDYVAPGESGGDKGISNANANPGTGC